LQEVWGMIKELAPEAVALLKRRYDILSEVHFNQPLGRRALAGKLKISERQLRTDLDILRKSGLLAVGAGGVFLTVRAENLLFTVQPFIGEAMGLSNIAQELAVGLNLLQAVVVPGDSDSVEAVIWNMGRMAAGLLLQALGPESVIAVMGGSTLAQVTAMVKGSYPGVTVVPARGGLGEDVETQANTIAAKLASQLGGSYRLLHVPENLDLRALEELRRDQRVRGVLSTIRCANILLYGIGRADVMARRRGLSGKDTAWLLTKGAVAEALGHYFNARGELVDKAPSLGIEVSDQPRLALSLAVAGGKSKAQAVAAALKRSKGQVLVTDEGAAREILEILRKTKKEGELE